MFLVSAARICNGGKSAGAITSTFGLTFRQCTAMQLLSSAVLYCVELFLLRLGLCEDWWKVMDTAPDGARNLLCLLLRCRRFMLDGIRLLSFAVLSSCSTIPSSKRRSKSKMLIASIGGLFIGGVIIYLAAPRLTPYLDILLRIACYFLKVNSFSERGRCRSVLACERIDNQGPQNTFSEEKSRAVPNQRLIDAFGINNAFTTSDHGYRLRFKALAAGKLKRIDEAEWKLIANMTLELVRRKTERLEYTDGAIPLVPFVQSITLSMSLYVLFKIEPLSLKEKTVADIANLINELWIASKGFYFRPLLTRKKTKLQKALGKIDSTFVFTPERTPLNFILPAYETMWRVVLRCFLEVVFRENNAAPEWREVLQAYLQSPTSWIFAGNASEQPDTVSVSHIANEALRLYPPTSRVYRTFKLGWKQKDFAANIEKCHRTDPVWGDDGKRFRPSRWTTTGNQYLTAFMSFGARPFVCPAKEVFGPQMIGILVASLAAQISPENWTVGDDDKSSADFGSLETPLESGREAFGSLKLWRKPVAAAGQQVTNL